jgi:protein-S-isoprenylcysteine O-methyltransferase Ste14
MPLVLPPIIWPFTAFAAFWVAMRPASKRAVEKQPLSEWFSYWILSFIAVVLLLGLADVHGFDVLIFQGSPATQTIGLSVEVLGLCVAVWARVTLGGNWSSSVTFKERHELVTRGPYRLVRHPIYSGMTAMFLGAAVYLGSVAGFLAVLLFFLSFLIKSGQEERLMVRHFPKEYARYRRTTKALIPFVY